MSRIETVKGVLKTFLTITMEDWDEMDHKLLRIAAGAIGFAVMAFFWYFVFRNVGPF
jgi:hypothetical protein